MAQEFDDLEFWLPSEFLSDDDLLTDFKADRFKAKELDDFSYGFRNSFGFNSDLSSPTTETESDDDDVISELTRKLAHSTLHHSSFSSDYAAKGLKLSGSPQSTLCGFKPGSRGSPNSASGVNSPLEAEDQRRWDLLYAAAGEVARMRMIEETVPFYSSKLYTPHGKPSPVTVPPQNPNPVSFYPNHHAQTQQNHLSYQMLQAAKFQKMKQHQMLKDRVADFQLQSGRRNGGDVRAHGFPASTWPALQQTRPQPSSGMTTGFLGEPAPKKERTGTGVFLPQRFGSVPSETRRKQASSTVLLPDRVVHALNFNRDAIDAHIQQRNNGRFNADYEAAMKQRNDLAMAQQQRRSLVSLPVMNHQQLRLPQEWTY